MARQLCSPRRTRPAVRGAMGVADNSSSAREPLPREDDLLRGLAEQLETAKATYGELRTEWRAARDHFLEATNDAAAVKGDVFIRRFRLQTAYDTNAPDPLFVQGASTFLSLRPRLKDPDQRRIVLAFEDCFAATFSPPGEDALPKYLLGKLGLGAWVSVTVGNSPWNPSLLRARRKRPSPALCPVPEGFAVPRVGSGCHRVPLGQGRVQQSRASRGERSVAPVEFRAA